MGPDLMAVLLLGLPVLLQTLALVGFFVGGLGVLLVRALRRRRREGEL